MSTLATGEMELKGRMPWSSNATFLAEVCEDGVIVPVIYKPARGERPLWDFPGGVYTREVVAYLLSEALGWGIVPETLLRDGPLGIGAVQRFVDADFQHHYFTLVEDPANHGALVRIAVFDLVANNADRKSGHCLVDEDGRIWGIDHGLCFHEEPKLRTVIWEFAGHAIDEGLRADLARFAAVPLPTGLAALLDADEQSALLRRAVAVSQLAELPDPGPHRPYPWPLV